MLPPNLQNGSGNGSTTRTNNEILSSGSKVKIVQAHVGMMINQDAHAY